MPSVIRWAQLTASRQSEFQRKLEAALANSSAVADVVCEGIVASWNPATKDVAALDAIVKAAPRRVRGIRWICNYDGALAAGESYVASRATWPRVEANFFLEGAAITKAFEEGLRLLSERGLSPQNSRIR